MPKATEGKGGKKGKALKGKAPKVSRAKGRGSKPLTVDTEEEVSEAGSYRIEEDVGGDFSEEQLTQEQHTPSQVAGEEEAEEKIAAFFEERPYYYDKADNDYKNKFKKNSQLAEFAATIGWNREYSTTYYFKIFLKCCEIN